MASGIHAALNNAKTSAEDKKLSSSQQAAIAKAKSDYASATTQAGRDAAHASAEAVRNAAGYKSDSSGYYAGTINKGNSSTKTTKTTTSSGIDKWSSDAGYTTFAGFGENVSKQINDAYGTNVSVKNVGADGKAPSDAKVGDYIVTNDGKNIYYLTGKNTDGSWQKEEITAAKGDAGSTVDAIINHSKNGAAAAESMPMIDLNDPNSIMEFLAQYGQKYQPTIDTSAIDNVQADYKTILKQLNAATETQFNTLEDDYSTLTDQYGDNLYNLQSLMLDASKRTRGTAGVSGAATGVGAATDLSALLGLAQEATASNTQLVQEGQKLKTDRAAALAGNVNTARDAANSANVNIQNLLNNIYSSNTQYGAAAMSALSQILYGMASGDATKYAADQNVAATKYSADSNLAAQQLIQAVTGSSYNSRSSGSKASSGTSGSGSATTWDSIADMISDGSEDAYMAFLNARGLYGDAAYAAQSDKENPASKEWLKRGGTNFWQKNQLSTSGSDYSQKGKTTNAGLSQK